MDDIFSIGGMFSGSDHLLAVSKTERTPAENGVFVWYDRRSVLSSSRSPRNPNINSSSIYRANETTHYNGEHFNLLVYRPDCQQETFN